MNNKIKSFVTEKNKHVVFVATVAFTIIVYSLLNHFLFFKPRTLPFAYLDESIPLIPEMIWFYVSMYFMMLVVFLQIKSLAVLNRAFYAYIYLQISAFAVFFFFPVGFPRELFPLPDTMDMGTKFLMDFIRQSDAPYNCFPSLHVGSSFLCTLILWHEHKMKCGVAFVWTCIVTFSTMATKQHYMVDAVGGVIFAFVNYFVFFRVLQLEAPKQPESLNHPAEQSSQKS